ncbi:interleukin-8 [Microcaecilia unicolor]|uniref:Interleukin-8-like n=1 Tax=Microcaecilia unicolor TaxID=1415580 RepID=A0A6P7X2R5_9AMPH|nr:interleukin-8-like [Microcaecilia unicolor]XP_030046482.1 interleukin-8-like [Microcaecilia unicolor]
METKMRMFAAALIVCLLSASLTEAMSLARMGTELRCQCIKTESGFIPRRFIQNVQLFPSGPHCSNAEVIATLKSGQRVCLEPTAPWVERIIKKILEGSDRPESQL